jgi:hypothetical protein
MARGCWNFEKSAGLRLEGRLRASDFLVDESTKLFLGFAGALLETAKELVFLSFFEEKVIVGQLGVLLLETSFGFVPVSFDF